MMPPSISQCRGMLGGNPYSRRRMSPERVPGKSNSRTYPPIVALMSKSFFPLRSFALGMSLSLRVEEVATG